AMPPPRLQATRVQTKSYRHRPAAPADLDEQVDEVRFRGQQLGELVADDEEAGQRREGCAAGTGLLVVTYRREVAGPAQQLLAPHQLAVDRAGPAVDQRQRAGEAGAAG